MTVKRPTNNKSISYAITVHNEDDSLSLLLERIYEYIRPPDEVVIVDDYSDNPNTVAILLKQKKVYQHKLNRNYAAQKNYLNSKCKNEYIFQLDADELPTRKLMENIPKLIARNPTIDLFWIPRQNYYVGMTQEHTQRWRWIPDDQNRINYPDNQGRLYKNKEMIRWSRRLHERIMGCKLYTIIPKNSGLDIIHKNSVEKQVRSNINYIKYFSNDEVKGK